MLSFLATYWRQLSSSLGPDTPMPVDAITQSDFDPEWYLAAYPDVAQAGVDPWEHYQLHGAGEGRLPRRNRAVVWDHALWRGAHAVMLSRLHALLEDAAASANEQRDARWALARWFAWQQKWEKVVTYLLPKSDPTRVISNVAHPRMALLAVEALCRLQLEGKLPTAYKRALPPLLKALKRRFPDQADTYLAEANMLLAKQGRDKARLKVLNQLFAAHGLSAITRRDTTKPLSLDNLAINARSLLTTHNSSFISVIVPLYNAENTIGTALRSLFDQQSVRLEIIVVDDASDDNGAGEIAKWQDIAPAHVSLTLISHATNQGAYAARNTGLAAASGDFITTHDSDDWSHPQKLASQWQALVDNPDAKACLTHWVRVTPELLFHRWRLDDEGWVYPNNSSLMLRREVIEMLGFWDAVTKNADTEYRERIEAAFGTESVIKALPGTPLSFGRADEGSLNQHSRSHLASQFSGLRYRYMQSARRWHASAETAQPLYMPQHPEQRLFVAPPAMLRGPGSAQARFAEVDVVSESSLFEAGWYLERYIDLQQATIEPLEHFYTAGTDERRDPGPHFSLSGYCRRYPEVASSGQHPLVHYMAEGQAKGLEALPVWEGDRQFIDRPTVMLCAHQAGASLYGAERSLLDVLDAMGELQWNVVVTLPEANNAEYEQALLTRCKALAVLPYGWWQVGKVPVSDTVGYFRNLIQRYSVKAVHGNTIVLDEPYVAAKLEGVATLTHVRELPAHDVALCNLFGATPEQVVAQVHQHADVIIANSACVARAFERETNDELAHPRLCVVPNTIEMAPLLTLPEVAFDMQPPSQDHGRVRVGMLSSNIAKKGLADVEIMAGHLQSLAPRVEVVLFGAKTLGIDALLRRQANGNVPGNIHYGGYVEQPAEALAQLDIVMNLSRFQESFGRTVLEAMAAGRPVVAYNWGALNELVVEGETGFLVPFAEPLAAAQCVAQLASDPSLRRRFGHAGRLRAETRFNAMELRNALANAYTLTQVSDFIHVTENGY